MTSCQNSLDTIIDFYGKIQTQHKMLAIFSPPTIRFILQLGVCVMPIHEKIRLLRQVKGLTQEEVADKLNL